MTLAEKIRYFSIFTQLGQFSPRRWKYMVISKRELLWNLFF